MKEVGTNIFLYLESKQRSLEGSGDTKTKMVILGMRCAQNHRHLGAKSEGNRCQKIPLFAKKKTEARNLKHVKDLLTREGMHWFISVPRHKVNQKQKMRGKIYKPHEYSPLVLNWLRRRGIYGEGKEKDGKEKEEGGETKKK